MVLLMCTVLAIGCAGAVGLSEEADHSSYTDFVFLTTTDMHGKCWDMNLLRGTEEKNNMLRVSSAVRQIREAFGKDNVLLLDNGDLFQGTPVSQVQLSRKAAGESSDPLVMALCLNEIKYDAFILGNHEFNFAWNTMHETYQWLEDNGVRVLAANAVWDGSDLLHAAGENVFTPYFVKTVTVNGREHKIGILGLENGDISRWDLPSNYPGIRFAHPENESYSSAYEASLYIPKMQAEGCEFIVVSYHGGIGETDEPLVFGANSENQGKRIAEEAEDIDMLILGHDHSSVYSSTFLTGPSGKQILVVNGGSQQLTKSVFRFSEDESGALQWELLSSENLVLGNFDVDSALKEKVQPYAEKAAIEVDAPIGIAGGDWDQSNDFYTFQTDSMDLISAAMMDAVTTGMTARYGESGKETLLAVYGLDHLDADMAMASVASSGYAVSPGSVSMKDLYRLYQYNNTLAALPMYGREIRAVMEENAESRLNARVINGKTFFYAKNDLFTNIVFGGLNFEYDLSRPVGERVQIQGFANGRAFREDTVYLVAVNNYILGNDSCGLRSFRADDTVPFLLKDGGDAKIIQDVLADYIRKETEEKGAVTPQAFNWNWKITYAADAVDLPAYDGKIVACLNTRPEDGQSCILYSETQERAVTSRINNGGLAQVAIPVYGDAMVDSLPEETLVLTVHVDAEGRIAMTDPAGRYLTGGVNGSLSLSTEPAEGDLSLWTLEEAKGGWYIVNAGAEGNQAIEASSDRFLMYSLEPAGTYVFNFYTPVE